MLYCQPNSFYDEMLYISKANDKFLKKLSLPQYNISNSILMIEPISYIIKIVLNEPNFSGTGNIIALRTFGVNNSLTMTADCTYMSVYYAIVVNGTLLISKGSISDVYMNNDGDTIYTTSDGYGDEYHYSIQDIANAGNDLYALYAYVYYNDNIFRPDNLLAKIPVILLKNLV
ncbi:hypothetical protein [Yersinia phage fHe-Yen9-03]|uniref:Uncharacterized protein n=1 Tax=Yersinia phage fHe-Yen9-03 TaxID=2052743 RepID=A0A2C9CY90_9CAUD|nr:hypothetical protein [Yersinia phage fHe-Yen9-03]